MTSGTRNQSFPVIRIVARSVEPTPVPKAPKAPWVVVCESVMMMTSPGFTRPASSNTMAAIASGLADNLVTRAAGVTLKETRRLIVVPREMPWSRVDLENALRISRAGGVICPASPGFYMRPQTIADLVDFLVGRLLDLLGVAHELNTRWNEPSV